ncbi:hypothetical protein [Evansella tamaricis]|uniref:Uncharacterized protein n=1 Tax=Evansella tamaricis TaxID=2069301 RepID=A0ABS6JDJ6_9BACI|nr:hypothetical protein [Evansella tamaricis]MBU9711739.1 hypothetical protein [Evansella tamaricis]
MDIFTFPDPSQDNMAYAYIIMIFVFLAAFITVNRLKKATKKAEEQDKLNEKRYESINKEGTDK